MTNLFNSIFVAGGDLRQLALASMLEKKGYNIKIFGFDTAIDTDNLKKAQSLDEISNCDILILPLPVSKDNFILNAPFSKHEITLSEISKKTTSKTRVFGGKISDAIQQYFHDTLIYDYFEREELSILNAIPTAEGAIEIALSEFPRTLHKSNCLIIGYGRIGKVLANRLKGFEANVTIAARKSTDFSWISANGFKAINSQELKQESFDYDIIFNTVPAIILNHEILKKIPKNSLIIDLASKPGGVDFSLARNSGLKVIWALSIPGKSAPITAGEIIGNTILNMLKESEVL